MSTENHHPEDREAQLQDWEKRKPESHSILSDLGQDARSGGVLIVLLALLALIAVYAFKNSGGESQVSADEEGISIAGRKTVPELKKLDSLDIPVPPPPPVQPIPEYDELALQRKQLELQEQMKQKQMEEARRKSAILISRINQTPTRSNSNDSSGSLSSSQGRGDPNNAFATSASGQSIAVSAASQIEHLEYKVMKGKMIDAVLEPRVNSDLPGMACAIVQQDVYGAQGRQKLIPWGSRICGVYKSELRKGQDRIFVIWNEVVRPDGVLVALDSVGSDQLGTTGMGGLVDTHFAEIFGTSALLAIIGAGAANAGVGDGDEYNSAAYYRQEVQHAASESAQQVLAPYTNMPPTVTVPQGSKVKIYVNRILDFTSLYKAEIEAARQNGVFFIR